MKLLIVLACLLAIAAAQQSKKVKEKKKSKNPICEKQLSVNVTTCCPGIPSLQKFFDQCSVQCNADTTTPPKRGKGDKQEKEKKEQNFKCIMPCVLQAANVLGPDGNITLDDLNAALVNGVSADWAQIVPSVTAECYANATAATKKPSKEKSEKPKNGTCLNQKIMKCVFKNLYLSCPSNVLVDSTDCSDLTAKISQCPCEHDRKGEKEGKREQKGTKGGKNEKQESKKDGKGKGKTTQAAIAA